MNASSEVPAAPPQHPLAAGVVRGELRAVARVCRLVDDGRGDYRTILKELFPHSGGAWTIGITGVPGAGKSTLTDKLISGFRAQGKRVAVVAIDPTSPFSGGAILGDRIRMQRHFTDRGVFIRSLATRGALGGLSRSAVDVVRVVDAWGADVVLIETVGVGQDELEITRTADSTLVVMAPGMGDEIQAIKAGILECADVFAVNKADRDGADATMRDLQMMIALGESQHARPDFMAQMGHGGLPGHAGDPSHATIGREAEAEAEAAAKRAERWLVPIERCVALRDEGTAEIISALERHRQWLRSTDAGKARRRQRLGQSFRNQLRNMLIECAEHEMRHAIEDAVDRVGRQEVDPYTASEQLMQAFQGRA